MQEKTCRRGYAGDDIHERTCGRGYVGETSCVSSPAYLLLRILSCISPLARPLLLSIIIIIISFVLASRWDGAYSAEMRPSGEIGVVEVQKLRVFAISAAITRPSAGICRT